MARPPRNTVDYFPFICKEGKTMYYIEEKYDNDGYATWWKILRQLGVTNFHYLNLNDVRELKYLSAKCKVSEEKLISIIDDLADLGEFHQDLWKQNKIIFSIKFVIHIRDAYKKRSNKCIDLKGLLTLLAELGIRPLDAKDEVQADQEEIKAQLSESISGAKNVKENLVEFWLNDLPNSEGLERVKKITGFTIEFLQTKIPEFRPKAETSYPNYEKFLTHFKNWVAKNPGNEPQSSGITTGKKK